MSKRKNKKGTSRNRKKQRRDRRFNIMTTIAFVGIVSLFLGVLPLAGICGAIFLLYLVGRPGEFTKGFK